jgi:hypothetical protein
MNTSRIALLLTALATLAAGAQIAPAGSFKVIATGTVMLKSDTSTTIFLHGNGTLVVHNRSQVVITESGSGSKKIQGQKVVYKNYTGQVHVKGSQVHVRFCNGDVRLRAKGKGYCYMNGKGKYWVDGHGPKPMNGEPKTVKYGNE